MVDLSNFILELICTFLVIVLFNFACTLLACLKRTFTAIRELKVCTNTTILAELIFHEPCSSYLNSLVMEAAFTTPTGFIVWHRTDEIDSENRLKLGYDNKVFCFKGTGTCLSKAIIQAALTECEKDLNNCSFI